MKTSKSLQRDPRKGRVGGVCAGLADYLNVEVWLIRIIVVTAFLLGGGAFVLVSYIAAWLILDKKTDDSIVSGGATSQFQSSNEYMGKGYTNRTNTEQPVNVKAKVWQSGLPPKQAFMNIQQRFIRSENRLRKLESYVTSKEFHLNRELNRL
ncbi:envelope stress response membrane protein PspC [Ningiella sp. W23]|uniref:envelope stress response membrane protein PspC n=1 Tax=Ningiella sp. W23 TaxID=3023715 RepID=UPI003757925E